MKNSGIMDLKKTGGVDVDKKIIGNLDDQTYRNYNELYDMILQCYRNISILDVYKKLQTEKTETYNMYSNISNHIIRLVQKDLALTIWKMYFDIDKKANTIPKFRNTINKTLREFDNRHKKIDKSKFNTDTIKKLECMRMKFLAHTDMTRSNNRIEIFELIEILDTMCNEFNNICSIIEDERVKGITDVNIGFQNMLYQGELLTLYSKEQD